MAATLNLPSSCDLSEVSSLRDKLLTLRGDDLDIDASAVEHFNALALQVLAAAAKTWRADGFSMRFTAISERLLDILTLIDLDVSGDRT